MCSFAMEDRPCEAFWPAMAAVVAVLVTAVNVVNVVIVLAVVIAVKATVDVRGFRYRYFLCNASGGGGIYLKGLQGVFSIMVSE